MGEIKLRSVHGYWLICEPCILTRNGKDFCPYVSLYREKDLGFVGTLGWREYPKSLKDALKELGFRWPKSKAYPPEKKSLQDGEDE